MKLNLVVCLVGFMLDSVWRAVVVVVVLVVLVVFCVPIFVLIGIVRILRVLILGDDGVVASSKIGSNGKMKSFGVIMGCSGWIRKYADPSKLNSGNEKFY